MCYYKYVTVRKGPDFVEFHAMHILTFKFCIYHNVDQI